MVLSLVVPMIIRLASLNFNPQWTNDDLETFVRYWLLSMNM
jgi:hypothetical protein